MATKTPSEWLRLLCRDWSLENEAVVAATDTRFLHYKSYLKGQLTSQLLCRLSISGNEGGGYPDTAYDPMAAVPIDFWKILGVHDEFDRAHIVANIERFCSLYNIRAGTLDESPLSPPCYAADAAAINDNVAVVGNNYFPEAMNPVVDPATTAAAAAAAGLSANYNEHAFLYPIEASATSVTMATKQYFGQPKVRQNNAVKSQERRLKAEMREREREAYSVRKAAEKAARLATREERRQRKVNMRKQREDYAQKQKEAALRRAAELVQSNRVPIEITRGAAAAQAAANAAVANAAIPAAEEALDRPFPGAYVSVPAKKGRSSIVISTASDLDQIVTHSNNLWAKYNAIAKEHNQKVNWIVVAKELGIHVKVREKYARMHARAKGRGFDFCNWGQFRIKDYPQYFLDPIGPVAEQPTKIEEPGKQESPLGEGGAPQQQQSLTVCVAAVTIQPVPLNNVHDIPNRDMVSLAAEAAGVVAGETSYSSNPAVIAAAAAAIQQQQHQPREAPGDELHVIPALPPANNEMPIDVMKNLELPDLGSATAV